MASVSLSLTTPFSNWKELGTIDGTAGAADAALGVDERSYAVAKALANVAYWEVEPGINAAELRFKSVTNNADFVVDVWVARNDNDNLIRLCTLTLKTGQQDEIGASNHWVDTITITNEAWLTTVKVAQPGTDLMASVMFDLCGYRRIVLHANTTCDEDLVVEGSGF